MPQVHQPDVSCPDCHKNHIRVMGQSLCTTLCRCDDCRHIFAVPAERQD